MGAQTTNQSSFVYKRREPEKTLLYSALVSGIEPWLAERKNDTSKTQFPDFVEKEFRGYLRCGLLLAALIPPPYIHLSRHFGVFSSSSKWRAKIVTRPAVKKGFTLCEETGNVIRMSWSKLLARVFKIDVARCPIYLTRINPDRWERVDTQPHIGLMLVALTIDPHPPLWKSWQTNNLGW
jgi:hypothetical protein